MAKTIKQTPFSRLSAAEKRIAIAEDILKQIKADQYNIERGTWLDIQPVEPVKAMEQKVVQSKMLQNALLGGKQTIVMEAPPARCTCCAVGAACASAIRLFNQDTLPGNPQDGFELGDYNEGVNILKKYFPASQVDLMEASFEERTDDHHGSAKPSDLIKAIEFGEQYEYDDERLQAICRNIIKNNGTFKP